MGDSSDSEEFYDAEEFTPIKGSKRSSLSKSSSVTENGDAPNKDKTPVSKNEDLALTTLGTVSTSAQVTPEDDRTTVKNVVQGRQRFQELRRCMQTEEEDEGVPDTVETGDQQTFTLEHPFKIIAHDTMSLQSMTSLGRIGRILSGASESHSNIRDTVPVPSASSREPSTISDEPLTSDSRSQTVLAMAEPDVIASTKANSLKQNRSSSAAIVSVSGSSAVRTAIHSGPIAPPRKKKRNKLYGSQSLSTTDGDNLSVCTADTDADTDADIDIGARRRHADMDADTDGGARRRHADTEADSVAGARRRSADKPQLDSLIVEASQCSSTNQSLALPSPASTIESLTREFQDSLELSHSKYASDRSSLNVFESRESERASDSSRSTSLSGKHRHHDPCHDLTHAVKADDRAGMVGAGGAAGARTHSEGRPPAAGHSSLGSATRRSNSECGGGGGRGRRRRSAGDEQHLGLALRTRSTSGHQLSDIEILEQVTVLNLDTGERVPLSVAEHKLPQCMNPLSLHIMRLTSEYIARPNDDDNARAEPKAKLSWRQRLSLTASGSSLGVLRRSPSSPLRPVRSNLSLADRETDEESESVCAGGGEDDAKEMKRASADRQTTAIRRKTDKIILIDIVKSHSQDNINKTLTHDMNIRLKRFFGSTVKKTVDAAKSLAQEVSHARHKEDVADIPDDVRGEHNIKLKASNSHKGPYDFDGCIRHVQEMGGGHSGAVWCCRFSGCGRLLATAGQDRLLRVWVARDAYHMFQDMRTKYNAEQKSSPTPSQESLSSLAAPPPAPADLPPLGPAAPFCPRPFCTYSGHTSDLLDVSWSKNYFILSSSMDKTVRLWHISRGECLCCFQHIDFVTAIVFHPRDDRYFLSGSLDGKLRLWNIPDKKVAVWNEVDGKTKLITAANFCQNGKFAVVGTYDGRCIFYTTDQLKYHTQLDVRSARGKNSTGRKISGVEPLNDKILVTSNDSRIRLYDLRDLNLSCKYKGYVNVSSQIKASFSPDGKYIVSGSENQCIYIWKTYHDYSKFTSVRRDRNDFWEGIKAHNAVVTCAVFAPNPDHMIRAIDEREAEAEAEAQGDGDVPVHKGAEGAKGAKGAEGGMVSASQAGQVLVSADFSGCIKVFVHRARPKHSSLPASALA